MDSDKGWHFDHEISNQSVLKALCLEVEQQFLFPPKKLYRYFAGSEDRHLQQEWPFGYGRYYRGFHAPRAACQRLPMYLQQCFFHPPERFASSATLDEMTVFDNLIYVRHSTCSDLTGFVANYAHELQHFMQHGYTPRLWAVNSALYQNLATYEPNALATDIPSERDAEIKSKQVAEIVHGVNAVREFAEKQVRLMEEAGAYKQKGKWVFFRDVPSSTNYDLLQATLSFVEKYKGRINFGIDVDGAEWWLGPIQQ